jgi:hypothetical protein
MKQATNYSLIITITILDIIHHPVFCLRTLRFGVWFLSPSSDGTYSDEPNRRTTLSPDFSNRDRLALFIGPI